MGIDKQSKGVHVYWPDRMMVGVEHNIYYDKTIASVSQFEGEESSIVKPKTDLTQCSKAFSPSKPHPYTSLSPKSSTSLTDQGTHSQTHL